MEECVSSCIGAKMLGRSYWYRPVYFFENVASRTSILMEDSSLVESRLCMTTREGDCLVELMAEHN